MLNFFSILFSSKCNFSTILRDNNDKKLKNISDGKRIKAVKMLNISFTVVAAKALPSEIELVDEVRAMKELVTHVPIFEPIIIGIAFFTDDINPVPTIVITIEVVAAAFWSKDVTRIPKKKQ